MIKTDEEKKGDGEAKAGAAGVEAAKKGEDQEPWIFGMGRD